jgi:hypothetical protein
MKSLHCIPLLFALSLLPACGKETPTKKEMVGSQKEPSTNETQDSKPNSKPKPSASPKFARWLSTGKTEGYYQTAIAHYEDNKGRSVDLIGAVHIGDRAYFEKLNKVFTKYDSLLYELVAKKGTLPKPHRKATNPLSLLQNFMTKVLDLRFQLQGIDYEAKNFVHADIDPSTFMKKLKEKNQTLSTMILQVMLRGMQQAREGKGSKLTIFHILAGALSDDGPRYFKFLFAQELGNLEKMLATFGGKKGEESVIVGSRNRAAFKVLDEQLAKGKKNLGIYFGAAHLPDMNDLLVKRGFRYVSTQWLTAWDCSLTPEQRKHYKELEAKKAARRKEILERRALRKKKK